MSRGLVAGLAVVLSLAAAAPAGAQVTLNTLSTYNENFDGLAASGTSSTLPGGAAFAEVRHQCEHLVHGRRRWLATG